MEPQGKFKNCRQARVSSHYLPNLSIVQPMQIARYRVEIHDFMDLQDARIGIIDCRMKF
jgi:hypothetical protein